MLIIIVCNNCSMVVVVVAVVAVAVVAVVPVVAVALDRALNQIKALSGWSCCFTRRKKFVKVTKIGVLI